MKLVQLLVCLQVSIKALNRPVDPLTTFSGTHPTKDFNHEDTDEWNTFMGLLERASFCHPNCPKDIESLYTKRSVLHNPFFDKLSIYE